MGNCCDRETTGILEALHQLVPRPKMLAMLDEVAAGSIDARTFGDFVWRTMAKSAAEKTFDRRWNVLELDLRKKATRMAVIYAMHCVYERAANGKSGLVLGQEEHAGWQRSKAG